MPLNRNSRIREAWKHPIGQDILQKLMRRIGRSETWPTGIVASNMRIASLDKLAGKGFADSLVALLNSRAGQVVRTAAPAKRAWWKEAVIYRVFLPSFMDADHDGIGDLAGVTQRLPYLAKMGVDALWLCPFLGLTAERDGEEDFLAMGSEIGTEQDFEELAAAAHRLNIRLIPEIDISATPDTHAWFTAALAGDETYQDYYYFKEGRQDTPPNNWSRNGASVWRWLPEMGKWVLCLCGESRPDLNWSNPRVKEEITALLCRWLDKGASGFALSPVSTLGKDSLADANPRLADAMEICGMERHTYGLQLHQHLRELRAGLPDDTFLMAEMPGIAPELAKLFTADSREEVDLLWDAAHLIPAKRMAETGRIYLQDLKEYYLQWADYGKECWMSLFIESPNLPRMVSRVGAGGIYRSTVAKMLGAMLLTLRGTPVVYQGQELGLPNTRFAGIQDMRSARTSRMYAELCLQCGEEAAFERVLTFAPDHARTPMPWSVGPFAGFTGAVPWQRLPDGTDHLNAAVQVQDRASVWSFYRTLIELRKKSPALQYGAFNPVFAQNKSVFCYFRILDNEKWYVEINLTGKQVSRPGRILRSQRLALSNYEGEARALRPYEANIYRCE